MSELFYPSITSGMWGPITPESRKTIIGKALHRQGDRY